MRNMTTKHNPATLPTNLYAVGPPDVQPLDFTKLGDHHTLACLQEMAKLGMKKKGWPSFCSRSEDPEKYIEEGSIICILTSYKHNQDVLELKEEELFLLQDETQQTSDVLTFSKSTEICANEHEVMRHS